MPGRFGLNAARVRLALLGLVALAAGCSSTPSPSTSTTSTTEGKRPPLATTSTTAATTVPAPNTSSTIAATGVQVEINGSTAAVEFTSASVSGTLSPNAGNFSQGDTVYTFTVSGVSFSGSPAPTTASGGLIASVRVAGDGGVPTITVTLASPATHASYGLGHDEVAVVFSS